jgi:hypothetical protein
MAKCRAENIVTFIGSLLLVLLNLAIAAVSQTTQVTVTANPLWTDTGITLTRGEAVSISATGSWNYSTGNIGPDGDPNYFGGYWDEFGFFDTADHGRLLGFIGTDPFQGQWGNRSFFPQTSRYISIGSGRTFAAATAGRLWLGINDDAITKQVADNSGQLVATITLGSSDTTAPKINLISPTKVYAVHQKVNANYSCTDPDDAVATCAGPVANGAPINTSAAGQHSFTVVATDSHGNTSTATAVYTVGSVGLAPQSLAFAPQTVGTMSRAQNVSLYNVQSVALNISSIGTSGDFVVTASTCGTVLAAHRSCSISVSSKPTATGSRVGSLNANDDAGAQSILLIGNGK